MRVASISLWMIRTYLSLYLENRRKHNSGSERLLHEEYPQEKTLSSVSFEKCCYIQDLLWRATVSLVQFDSFMPVTDTANSY